MPPLPLKEIRSAMAALNQADYKFYFFAYSDASPSPPVHTIPDPHTASLLSDYLGKVARGAKAEDIHFTVLYPEEVVEEDDDEIFREDFDPNPELSLLVADRSDEFIEATPQLSRRLVTQTRDLNQRLEEEEVVAEDSLEEGELVDIIPVRSPSPLPMAAVSPEIQPRSKNADMVPMVLDDSDDDFLPAPPRLPVPTAKLSPPRSSLFPVFSKGPLSTFEKNCKDVSFFLRRALRVYHPKTAGPFGTGKNVWWDVRVPCSGLTSNISLAAVGDRQDFCPGDFLPWEEMNLGTKFHSGPGAQSGVFLQPIFWNHFKILLLEHLCLLSGFNVQHDSREKRPAEVVKPRNHTGGRLLSDFVRRNGAPPAARFEEVEVLPEREVALLQDELELQEQEVALHVQEEEVEVQVQQEEVAPSVDLQQEQQFMDVLEPSLLPTTICLREWVEKQHQYPTLADLFPQGHHITLQILDFTLAGGRPTGQVILTDGEVTIPAMLGAEGSRRRKEYIEYMVQRRFGKFSLVKVTGTEGSPTHLSIIRMFAPAAIQLDPKAPVVSTPLLSVLPALTSTTTGSSPARFSSPMPVTSGAPSTSGGRGRGGVTGPSARGRGRGRGRGSAPATTTGQLSITPQTMTVYCR